MKMVYVQIGMYKNRIRLVREIVSGKGTEGVGVRNGKEDSHLCIYYFLYFKIFDFEIILQSQK